MSTPNNNTDTHADNDTPIVPKGRSLHHTDTPHIVGETLPHYVPHHMPTDNTSDIDGCIVWNTVATVDSYIDERIAMTQELKDKHEILDAIVTLYKHDMIGKEELVKLIDEKL